jgi:hypothetical protein
MTYRIVNTDNFGGDYPNESFVDEAFETKEAAQMRADELNVGGDHAPRYFKVVEMPYELRPGFEP